MSGGVMWWDLYSTIAQQAQYEDFYRSVPPQACPNCGWPLQPGPVDQQGVLFCPHGDFEYPRDWDAQSMSGM